MDLYCVFFFSFHWAEFWGQPGAFDVFWEISIPSTPLCEDMAS